MRLRICVRIRAKALCCSNPIELSGHFFRTAASTLDLESELKDAWRLRFRNLAEDG